MLWMLPIAGAGLGAMLNKKDPLKGAAVGGLLGAGGAYAAPSLSSGLLNFSGGQAAAPIVDMSTKAAPETVAAIAGKSGGFASGLQSAGQIAGAMSQAGAFGGGQQQQQQPMQHAQANPQVFSSLLSPTDQVDMEKRRQAQQMAVQGLLGGYRG